MNADPNEQLMRIPVVKILSFSLRNGHGVVVGLVRLLVVVLYHNKISLYSDDDDLYTRTHVRHP